MSKSDLDKAKWEALPPRKKSKQTDEIENESKNRLHVKQHQNIIDNINARKCVVKAVSSLESKDGAAGENFECLFFELIF